MAVYHSKNLHAYCVWWCCPQCSVFYRVKGHILVEILVCALTGHISWWISFKFCMTDVHHSQTLHTYSFWWCCPQCSVFYRVKGHILVHILVCALTGCISWRISFKFCMEVYHSKLYKPLVFGDAAPSVPSFIGSKVIFWWKSCVCSAGHISWWISFKFCTDAHHSQIYTPVAFGDAAPSVPSFIGSRSYFGSHSCVRTNNCISWWFSFKFCMEVYLSQLYTPIVFGDATPSVPSL